MANLITLNADFCSISNLKNYILTAYPLYLVLGLPLKTADGIKYERNSYFKIRSADFERWFKCLNFAQEFMDSENNEPISGVIIEEKDFSYKFDCNVSDKVKILKIELSQPGLEPLCFIFEMCELKMFISAFADLMLNVFCFPDNLMELCARIINHYLSFKCSLNKVAGIISNLKSHDVNKLCKRICEKFEIQGSLYNFSELILRHKSDLLIVYLMKRSSPIPKSNLLSKYI
jgi:hypothetical protein